MTSKKRTKKGSKETQTSDEFKKWLEASSETPDVDQRDRRIHALQQQLLETRRTNKALQTELDHSEERVNIALSLGAPPKKLKPFKYTKKSKNAAVPVMMASDWHVEETVDPATVNNRNKFDPSIAEIRAQRFFVGQTWMINQCHQGWDIKEAVLWLGGDMISGYIHEELQESNAMSPTEALLFCQNILANGIHYLLKHAGIQRLQVPCSFGNHGRTTKRS